MQQRIGQTEDRKLQDLMELKQKVDTKEKQLEHD